MVHLSIKHIATRYPFDIKARYYLFFPDFFPDLCFRQICVKEGSAMGVPSQLEAIKTCFITYKIYAHLTKKQPSKDFERFYIKKRAKVQHRELHQSLRHMLYISCKDCNKMLINL